MAQEEKSYVKEFNLNLSVGDVLGTSEVCPLPDGFEHLRGWIVFNTITENDKGVALQLLEPVSKTENFANYRQALIHQFHMASKGHIGSRLMTLDDAKLIKENLVDRGLNYQAKLNVDGEGRDLSYWLQTTPLVKSALVYHMRQGKEYQTTLDDQASVRLTQDVTFEYPIKGLQRLKAMLL